MRQIYLDSNAHVPINEKALQKMISLNSSIAGHGHAMSKSEPGRKAALEIERGREKIAKLIGADNAGQIIFTSTCSQACEWAIYLLSNLYESVHISQSEHSSVKYAVHNYFSKIIDIPINQHGITSTYELNSDEPIVCIHVQNEIGTIQPINNFSYHYGKPFIVSDMSQTLGKIPLDMKKFPNIEMAMFGAHKFGGPPGVGFLFIRDTGIWKEFGTGSRYFLDRTGTPDMLLIAATSVALEEAIRTIPIRYENMINFRNILEAGLKDLSWGIIGEKGNRVPNTTYGKVANNLGTTLMVQLGGEGIHIGLGSACGGISNGPTPLMAAMGQGGGSQNYVRISQFGEYGADEARFVLDKIRRYCREKPID